jgi:hypothetical protein
VVELGMIYCVTNCYSTVKYAGSRGKRILTRVFEMRDEIKIFLHDTDNACKDFSIISNGLSQRYIQYLD